MPNESCWPTSASPRRLDDISGLTATNMTVGTVSYAAPEQLMDAPIDGRADQYSLAATAGPTLTTTATTSALPPPPPPPPATTTTTTPRPQVNCGVNVRSAAVVRAVALVESTAMYPLDPDNAWGNFDPCA